MSESFEHNPSKEEILSPEVTELHDMREEMKALLTSLQYYEAIEMDETNLTLTITFTDDELALIMPQFDTFIKTAMKYGYTMTQNFNQFIITKSN